jgi:hypothetical protein
MPHVGCRPILAERTFDSLILHTMRRLSSQEMHLVALE